MGGNAGDFKSLVPRLLATDCQSGHRDEGFFVTEKRKSSARLEKLASLCLITGCISFLVAAINFPGSKSQSGL